MNAQPNPEPKVFASQDEIARLCLECCNGDKEAINFCHMWFTYCHAIDDLIDTQISGAITMTPEAILEIFVQANLLYNCSFYRQYQSALQPVVLVITNAYADSVEWEKSDVKRRATIADVLRCCGNEMFFTVAMICGGWKHARSVSSRIREMSWELQHDDNDQPN